MSDLPIYSTRHLIKNLDGAVKNKVLEIVTRYRADDYPLPIHCYRGGGWIEWGPAQWPSLFFYPVASDEAVFIQYFKGPVIWVYRGRYSVDSDLYGPKAIICRDRLKCLHPIFSVESVDGGKLS